MILLLAKGLAFFGVDLQLAQRIVFWALIVFGLILALILVFSIKSCMNKPSVMTEQEKQEVQNAIADRDEKKLKEKLVELDVKEQVVEGNVANSEVEKVNAIAESKKKWANANVSELQAEFDRRMNQ